MVKREYACAERHSSGAEDTMIAPRSDVQTDADADADGREEAGRKNPEHTNGNESVRAVRSA